ncbi:MAG: polysaccharide deacetylase family protein [Verrucomicrobia bacterium]|nr:polysaccharide deacetylase family protein [Verrucomicrobiota bacterium]
MTNPLKALVAPVVHRLAFASGSSLAKARALRVMRIITFHGVGAEDCTIESFEAHLRLLQENFRVVPLAEIVDKLQRGGSEGDEVALTFDDGLRNNLSHAYPLLQQFRLPATFFVCPGLIEHRRWLWVHEARRRLNSLATEARRELAASLGLDSGDANTIVEWMKTLPLRSRRHVEQVIRNTTPQFAPTDAMRHRYELMTWDELRSLDPSLITIGGHTVNHPILANSTQEELEFEIRDCRLLLEKELQRPVDFFCYPNGDYNPAVLSCARQHYRAAVSVRPDFVKPGDDVHQLPRLNNADTPAHFLWRLHRPTA